MGHENEFCEQFELNGQSVYICMSEFAHHLLCLLASSQPAWNLNSSDWHLEPKMRFQTNAEFTSVNEESINLVKSYFSLFCVFCSANFLTPSNTFKQLSFFLSVHFYY